MGGYMTMLFKLKNEPTLTKNNGEIIVNKVWVENNTLYLVDNDTTYKLENDNWYIKTPLTNDEFISLGIGALPTYLTNNVDVEDIDAFNGLFEPCETDNV